VIHPTTAPTGDAKAAAMSICSNCGRLSDVKILSRSLRLWPRVSNSGELTAGLAPRATVISLGTAATLTDFTRWVIICGQLPVLSPIRQRGEAVTERPAESIVDSAFAGGAIGLLVGVAAGLSSAPVIAVVVGAISAGLLILLGLKRGDAAAEHAAAHNASGAMMARVAAFGIVCTLALVGGVMARAYDVLSPSAIKLAEGWKAAGFAPDPARDIALYQKVGLTFSKIDGKAGELVAHRESAAGTQSSSLFAASSTSVCPYFDPNNYGTTDDMLHAMKLQGGGLEKFANAVEKLAPAQRDEVVKSTGGLLCGH
jgi:hypothetical protein